MSDAASPAVKASVDVPASHGLLVMLRLALGAVLLVAGVLKLNKGWEFSANIANFRLMPAQANQLLAVIVPWNEVVAGLMLILGVWARGAALLSAAMFASFAGAIAISIVRGLDIECGCFGTGSAARVGMKMLALDTGCLVAALTIFWLSRERSDNKTELQTSCNPGNVQAAVD